jgi:16S rRNA processing protein RimM
MAGKRKDTDYLIIGKITRAFGIRGEVKVLPITDSVRRFEELEVVFLSTGNGFRPLAVDHARTAGSSAVLKLSGIDSRDAAEQLQDELLYVDRMHAAELEKGSCYFYDLLGCTVTITDGTIVGTVQDIRNFGSCDLYFVRRPDGSEVILPAVKDVVESIDLDTKNIVIRPVEGLLD